MQWQFVRKPKPNIFKLSAKNSLNLQLVPVWDQECRIVRVQEKKLQLQADFMS